MPFVFPHFIVAAIKYVKVSGGSIENYLTSYNYFSQES